MSEPAATWILLADLRRARLIEADVSAQGSLQLTEKDSLQSDWTGFEHGRPSPLSGRGDQAYASEEPEKLEELHHFGRSLARWIEKKIQHLPAEPLRVIAPARLLGVLRKLVPQHLHRRLKLSEAELAHLSLGQLSQHPGLRRRLVS